MSKMLTRADFLKAKPAAEYPPVSVPCPGLGGEVYVRRISAAERDAYDHRRFAEGEDGEGTTADNFRAELLVLCLCDAKGKAMFLADDAAVIGRLPTALVDGLFRAAARLNGIGGDNEAAAVADAEKNSGGAPDSGSPSA